MKIDRLQYSDTLQQLTGKRYNTYVYLLCFIMVIVFNKGVFTQIVTVTDTIQSEIEIQGDTVITRNDTSAAGLHSAHKATLYSMILPGLGQAYNKKYWKIPIIYAGFGVFYYLIDYNNTEYQLWKDAYYHSVQDPDGLEDPVNEYEELYGDNPDFLRDRKDDARRYRDLNYILAGVWYLLNVLDATVDAHLFSWNVDENLSLRVEPHIYNQVGLQKPTGGLKFSLRF